MGEEEIPLVIAQPYAFPILDLKYQQRWNIPEEVVITAAVTGVIIDRSGNPKQPYTTEEILKESMAVVDAGATALHIHTRDPATGLYTTDRKPIHDVIDPLKEKYGKNVVIGGEALFGENFEELMYPIKAGLYEVSPVNTCGMFVGDALFANPPPFLQAATKYFQEHGTKPQIAVYNPGDIDNAYRWLIKPKIIEPPFEWIVVPAIPGAMPMTNSRAMIEALLFFERRIREVDPTDSPFITVCSSGRASSYITALTMLLGHNVRVGMEDTIYQYPHKDDMLTNNTESIKITTALAEALGRRPATAEEYRKRLGIK
ncbi:MAG: 3-keto-5-aminohexanoate cleavage protein [Candidatus Lokiarchaeia archaeon]